MYVNAGIVALDEAQQVQVPGKGQTATAWMRFLRYQTALQKNLCATDRKQFFDFPADLIETENVRLRIARIAGEVAEKAPGSTNIRIIDVPINHVRAVRFGMQLQTALKRHAAKLMQRRVQVELQRLLIGQPARYSGKSAHLHRELART